MNTRHARFLARRSGQLVPLLVAAVVLVLAAPRAAAAQADVPDTPAGAALERLIAWVNGTEIDEPETFFDEVFLEAIPPERLNAVRSMMVDRFFGPGEVTLDRIEQQLNAHELDAILVGAGGTHVRTRLGLDFQTGLVNRLNFAPAPELDDTAPSSWHELVAALEALPGTVGLGVYELVADTPGDDDEHADLREIATLNPDVPLALGSSFKLYVLGALGEAVAAGEHAWLDTIEVDEDLKSLPSGKMQTLPAGTALTLDAVATDMIRISDNTATDHLIHLLGRDRVEAYTLAHDPEAGAWFPFLTTKEMFQLKLGGDDELMARYAAADTAERRKLIDDEGPVSALVPNLMAATFWRAPREIDRIEWFGSMRTIADLHARLDVRSEADERFAATMRQNPGVTFSRDDFPIIAFKGGSEPGVLCLAWLLERNDGRKFALTMAWNDTESAVDEPAMIDLALIAGTLLAKED